MKNSDKVKRAAAFYVSVTVFIILLPIVLSYSLGYRIDYMASRIYKTGIIFIDSNPAGAAVYVNGKEHPNLTPARIEELKPGTYKIEVRREGFYPWEKDLVVRPNMVTKADRIVLFPLTQDMKKVNDLEVSDFAMSDKGFIFYLTPSGLFRSSPDGSVLRRLSKYSSWPKRLIAKKFSPDYQKLLFFNDRTIGVINLTSEGPRSPIIDEARVDEILTSQDPVVDAFWHSASNYIIVVTKRDIKVVELRGGGTRNIVSLYKFRVEPESVFYDSSSDLLYFTDMKRGPDQRESRQLYRLDLRQKFFESLMKLILRKEIESGDERQ